MKRVNLTIDDGLYRHLEAVAAVRGISINTLITDTVIRANLKHTESCKPSDSYESAIAYLEDELDHLLPGNAVSFSMLFSENDLKRISVRMGASLPSVRSRLGKRFARLIASSEQFEAVYEMGKPKRYNGSAVYKKISL